MRLYRFELRWLDSIFDAMLPSGVAAALPEGAHDLPMDRFVRDLVRHAPARMVLGLRLALWLVTLAPLVLVSGWRLFPSLPADVRLAVLRRLRKHPRYLIREAVDLLKGILCLGYCGMPSVQAGIGVRSGASVPSWAAAAPADQRDEPRRHTH